MMSGSMPAVLVGEQAAGAAHAGLHFVDDQQQAVLAGEFAQGLHEVRLGGDHAAFALHRLEHHRDGLGADQRLHRVDVVEVAFGKPGTCGAKRVSQPGLPEADMVARVRPWKEWSKVMIS
jgi:hypothetical protein